MVDFSGYATKSGLKCTDGRTIFPDAFRHQDGKTVPLIWQHGHNSVENVLGHVRLENRTDGVYAYGTFNDTPAAQHAKRAVLSGDITGMSIFANKLIEENKLVKHGMIREVSLVLSGANPGAFIDNVTIKHGDSYEVSEDEAVIYTGLTISTATKEKKPKMTKNLKHENTDPTIGEVWASLTDMQKNVVYAIIADLTDPNSDTMAQSDIEGEFEGMPRNVFQQDESPLEQHTLSHSEVDSIFADARRVGSLKEAVLKHAQDYGIENIDILFPDAKSLTNSPTFIARRTEWVDGVLKATKHSPFAKVKIVHADITEAEARAKGYIKGTRKKEEVFKLLKRSTAPTTIYKKQKLDRDDEVDITSFNVVAFMKAEMRVMLDEEIARAILVGDGRQIDDPDKINEDKLIPIYKDDALYAIRKQIAGASDVPATVDELIRARKSYRGSGSPSLYANSDDITDLLLARNPLTGERYWKSEAELAAELRVKEIISIDQFEGISRESGGQTLNLVGIIVNLQDYTVGADSGGEITMFDDFDIDYNQKKFLMETRISGMLTLPYSAVIVERPAA